MKYQYVTVELQNFGPGSAHLEAHREIIDTQAEQGHRYVGFVPTKIGPSGKIIAIDLVFEVQE